MLVRWLRRADRWLGAVEVGGVVAALFAMIFLSLFEIVTRNAGAYSPPWVDPLRRQLVLWGGLLGAGLAVRHQAHIHFDFVQPRLKGKTAIAARWVVSLAGALVCFYLARAAYRFSSSEMGGNASIAGIPAWFFTTIIPVAFAFMAIHFLLAPVVGTDSVQGAEASKDSRRS